MALSFLQAWWTGARIAPRRLLSSASPNQWQPTSSNKESAVIASVPVNSGFFPEVHISHWESRPLLVNSLLFKPSLNVEFLSSKKPLRLNITTYKCFLVGNRDCRYPITEREDPGPAGPWAGLSLCSQSLGFSALKRLTQFSPWCDWLNGVLRL